MRAVANVGQVVFSYPTPAVNVPLAQLSVVLHGGRVHDDRSHGGDELGDLGALVLGPDDPGDFITPHFPRLLPGRHRLALHEDPRVVHGHDGAMNGFRPLPPHEIVHHTDAILLKVPHYELAHLGQPLHSISLNLLLSKKRQLVSWVVN